MICARVFFRKIVLNLFFDKKTMLIILIFCHLNQHKKHCLFLNQPPLELYPISNIRESERCVVIHNLVCATVESAAFKRFNIQIFKDKMVCQALFVNGVFDCERKFDIGVHFLLVRLVFLSRHLLL